MKNFNLRNIGLGVLLTATAGTGVLAIRSANKVQESFNQLETELGMLIQNAEDQKVGEKACEKVEEVCCTGKTAEELTGIVQVQCPFYLIDRCKKASQACFTIIKSM